MFHMCIGLTLLQLSPLDMIVHEKLLCLWIVSKLQVTQAKHEGSYGELWLK